MKDYITCPECGFECMHHGAVRVYNRPVEDGPVMLVETGSRTPLFIGTQSQELPTRRDMVEIDFICESGHASTMRIRQHKGTTFVDWIQRPPVKFEF